MEQERYLNKPDRINSEKFVRLLDTGQLMGDPIYYCNSLSLALNDGSFSRCIGLRQCCNLLALRQHARTTVNDNHCLQRAGVSA